MFFEVDQRPSIKAGRVDLVSGLPFEDSWNEAVENLSDVIRMMMIMIMTMMMTMRTMIMMNMVMTTTIMMMIITSAWIAFDDEELKITNEM